MRRPRFTPVADHALLVTFGEVIGDDTSAQVQSHVQALLDQGASEPVQGQVREVEVCYDPEFAPDLPAVAGACGLSVEQVIGLHQQAPYRVRMYGFAPGFAYLSGVPAAIQVPRKPSATRGIASGSVLMAGPQCLVTTLVMPTGWSVIGRSPTRILDPDSPTPFLFEVGDSVRFVRIDRARYDALCGARDDG